MFLSAFIAILVMMATELWLSRRQRREPQLLAVTVCGILGIGYFVAVLYAGSRP